MVEGDEHDPVQERTAPAIEEWLEGERSGHSSGFICPSCGGAIWLERIGPLQRYRCHTGHRFSPESFNQAQAELLERTLWNAVALLEQRIAFLHKMATQATPDRPWTAERFLGRAAKLEPGTELLRRLLDDTAPPPPSPEAGTV
jgi:two-component system chemotaxis response regulator CheB